MDEGTEDDLGTAGTTQSVTCSSKVGEAGIIPSLRKSHPQDEDKLESVVEGCSTLEASQAGTRDRHTEPVNSVYGTLKYGQKGIDHPVLSYINTRDVEL